MRFALLLALSLPGAAADPLLVAVVPDLPGPGPGDEGFAVGCRVDCDLGGLQVTDREATWSIPAMRVPANTLAWFTGNLTAWSSRDGPPAATWGASRLQLGNEEDSLQLLDGQGRILDAFAWGSRSVDGVDSAIPFTSPGLVYQRQRGADGWLDTDSASDWVTPREHRIGESRLGQPTWTVGALTLYSSPDSSFEVLHGLINGARHRLHLHVYEFRSTLLADAIVAALEANPGLDVQVLADGSPVGMDAAERHATADALRRIQQAGGRVVLSGSGRYDDHHLKVLVADGAVAVQSENWVEAGVPADPSWGNRGWGAVVHDPVAADWFAAWMAADRDAWDAVPFDLGRFDPLFEPPGRQAPRVGDYGPPVPPLRLEGTFRVTPIVSPDHTQADDLALQRIESAVRRAWVQELDLATEARNRLGWAARDPWLAALADASLRGVDVRVQAAAPFSAEDTGNEAALAWLDARAPDLRARTFARPGIVTLHNKGLILDDAVVLGSTNGNHHSRTANREVSLLLEGPGVADFYAGLFLADAGRHSLPRDWGVPARDLKAIPATPLPTLLALLGVVAAVRR